MADHSDDIAALLDQRRALVEFGRTALNRDDLDDILHQACVLCREALGTDFSKVMRLEASGTRLRVIAGVGWDPGVVGEEVVPAVRESSEGFALSMGRPAVAEDVSEADEFDYPEFLKRHGVEAIVNVVIPGADDRPPYGLLQVDSRTPREFSDSDIAFLQGYANVLGSAIERFRRSEELAQALSDKARALEELEHRVMNNLAILQGMLRTRARDTEQPVVRQEIATISAYVETLAHLHRLLSAAGDIDQIDIGSFLNVICASMAALGSTAETEVEVFAEVERVAAASATAIPLGIIANEFITNSIKYAVIDGVCRIHLHVGRDGDRARIVLRDEGCGSDAGRDGPATGSGLGSRLMRGLGAQIGAEMDWRLDGTARLEIVLPLSPPAPAGAGRGPVGPRA